MMGITEVNPLAAHYRCSKCKLSIFDDENGNPLGAEYSSGFDLPDKECPTCHIPLIKDGQDMPFATFFCLCKENECNRSFFGVTSVLRGLFLLLISSTSCFVCSAGLGLCSCGGNALCLGQLRYLVYLIC